MLTRRNVLRSAVAGLTMPLLDPLRAVAAEVKRVRITDVESFGVRIPRGVHQMDVMPESNSGTAPNPCWSARTELGSASQSLSRPLECKQAFSIILF